MELESRPSENESNREQTVPFRRPVLETQAD